MIRSFTAGSIVAFVAVLALAPTAVSAKSERAAKAAAKQAEKEKKASVKEDKAGGKLLETFGDWTASLAAGKTMTCYALAKPKQSSPEGKRAQAYIFIADRPTEKVRNEVSIIPGFPIKEGSAAKAKVGKASFDLVAVANAFFMKDTAEDNHFVETLKHGGVLVVKTPPLKGSLTTDTYSLTGFKQALDRAQKECK